MSGDALLQRLLAFDTCTLSDALDKLGKTGAVSGLARMSGRGRVAGRAVTVKLGPPVAGLPKVHLGARAVAAADAASVIVIEHRGRLDASGWGGLLGRGAVRKGVRGVVIDGAFRDIDECNELGLSVHARAAVPMTARGRVAEHGFNEPVTISTVVVRPGDYVLADGSGVVFLAPDDGESVVAEAETIARKERLMADRIDRGDPITEVLGADYEDMLRGRENG